MHDFTFERRRQASLAAARRQFVGKRKAFAGRTFVHRKLRIGCLVTNLTQAFALGELKTIRVISFGETRTKHFDPTNTHVYAGAPATRPTFLSVHRDRCNTFPLCKIILCAIVCCSSVLV